VWTLYSYLPLISSFYLLQRSLDPALPLELFSIILLTLISFADDINTKAKDFSKKSLLEQSWAQAEFGPGIPTPQNL